MNIFVGRTREFRWGGQDKRRSITAYCPISTYRLFGERSSVVRFFSERTQCRLLPPYGRRFWDKNRFRQRRGNNVRPLERARL